MYAEIPLNYETIKDYVREDTDRIIHSIASQQKIIFYDACAFYKHACLSNPECIFSYLRQANAIVIITRCILMELASTSQLLHSDCITYFQQLHNAGIPVYIFNEEDLFLILEQCFSSNAQINKFLFWAIAAIRRQSSTIRTTCNSNPVLYQNLFVNTSSERTIYPQFFRAVRQNKEPDDNLGEELLAVCVHILSNLPYCRKYQFLIFTEDKGAILLISSTATNSYKQLQQYNFSAITTPRLAQHLYNKKILTSVEQIIQFLSSENTASSITVFGSGPYDLAPQKITLSIPELAQKIATPGAIHIYY